MQRLDRVVKQLLPHVPDGPGWKVVLYIQPVHVTSVFTSTVLRNGRCTYTPNILITTKDRQITHTQCAIHLLVDLFLLSTFCLGLWDIGTACLF